MVDKKILDNAYEQAIESGLITPLATVLENYEYPNQPIIVVLPMPMALEQFANTNGKTVKTIQSQVDRGHLPSLKVGKHRYVNAPEIVLERLIEVLKRGYK